MPRFSILLKILGLAYASLSSIPFQAQTCRVNCGVNSEGIQTYFEAYEYDYVDVKPAFPGGDEKLVRYVNNTRVYPEKAYKKGMQGRVMCSFVILADGSVSNVKVVRGVETTLNAEAVRIIEAMPQWTPGKMEGKPVPVRIIYPIPFRK